MDRWRRERFDEDHMFVRCEHPQTFVNLGNRSACGSQATDTTTQTRIAPFVASNLNPRLVEVGR